MTAPLIEGACPNCGLDVLAHGDGIPSDGQPYLCSCGFMGIWDSHYWREPTAFERAEMLSDDGIVAHLYAGIWASMMLDADRARMEAIVSEELQAAGYRPLLVDLEAVVSAIGARLRAGGFHTHTVDDTPDF